MHCKSCVLLIERELKKVPEIKDVSADLGSFSVKVDGEFGDKAPEEIAKELSGLIIEKGYTLSVEKPEEPASAKSFGVAKKAWDEFALAVPFAVAFFILFFLLQKAGLVNLVGGGKMSFGAIFLIGVIASLSSCMAVVGGLLLSMSATFAKEGDAIKPQALFHAGRLISFLILGGVIGTIGSAFQLNTSATFAIGFLVGIVMLILGLNLLDIFQFAKKLQPSMPKFLSKRALGVSELNHTLTPLLVGIATFFLPCGFTQSMQIYALSTGNFWSGALTMFTFALGTFPVLAALSFSSFSIQKSPKAGVFFKTAGLVVIIFAIFNIINSLVVIGIMRPIFNF